MSGVAGPTDGRGRPAEPILGPIGAGERALAEAIAYHSRWQPAPCRVASRDTDLWLSTKQSERDKAAAECEGCPFVELCLEAAHELGPTWGVWGSVDFSTPSPKKARSTR